MLIPVQPSPYDIWAADEIVKLIAEAIVFKENIKSCFVINRKIANTAIGRDVRDALAIYPQPVLQATVAQRVVFAEAAARGLTVDELDAHSIASQEIAALLQELTGVLS